MSKASDYRDRRFTDEPCPLCGSEQGKRCVNYKGTGKAPCRLLKEGLTGQAPPRRRRRDAGRELPEVAGVVFVREENGQLVFKAPDDPECRLQGR